MRGASGDLSALVDPEPAFLLVFLNKGNQPNQKRLGFSVSAKNGRVFHRTNEDREKMEIANMPEIMKLRIRFVLRPRPPPPLPSVVAGPT